MGRRRPPPAEESGEDTPEERARDRRSSRSRSSRSLKKHRVLRLPVIRGVVALWESLAIGFKALGISANAQLPEGEEEISCKAWTGTIIFALALSVGLFFLLPATLASISGAGEDNGVVFVVVEKLIRISIFLGYLWLISRMKDLQRVFQYHGAEHKTISCYEAGLALTPENAQQLLAPAPALRHELPAHRDDRGDLRLRAVRQARRGTGCSSRASSASRSSPAWRSRRSSGSGATATSAGRARSCGRACSSSG